MKRFSICIIILCLFLCLAVPVYAGPEEVDADYYSQLKGQRASINVYNWGEYISDGSDDLMDVNKEFEELTGIRVNYTLFATNEELYSKLRGGGAQYDIIIPSDYMISRLIKEDMLEEIDLSNIPNYQYIDEDFRGLIFDPENRYSVPYTWGTLGIIYNQTMVDEDDDLETWDILWNEKYAGNILMISNPRDSFAVAAFKLGYSVNSNDPAHLRTELEALKEQKLLVQAYVMDEIFDKMLGGEAALSVYYAGDAVTMIDQNPDLAFAYPREGTNRFVDAVCIPKGSKNKLAAEMYINFLCEPEVAAANAEYIGYSTPNWGALEYLDEEITDDPIAYPSGDIIANTEMYLLLDDSTNLLMDELWAELLSANEQLNWLMPAFLVSAILLMVYINVTRSVRKRRERMNLQHPKNRL